MAAIWVIRVYGALMIAEKWGHVQGAHHKQWVIDQMVRALIPEPDGYDNWVTLYKATTGNEWDKGIAP